MQNNLAALAPALDPMVPRVATVVSRRYEGSDIWTFDFDLPGGMVYTPGQFNMLYAFGIGEVAISMSGDPASQGHLIHTIRDVGQNSGALTRLEVGDAVGVRGPFGHGWPMDAAVGRDVLVVAGGLGLAPLRPALYRLLAERERYGKISLLFGARTPEDILFRQELEEWRRRLDITIEVTVDRAKSGWQGHVGVVTTLIRRADFDPARAVAFVCGPETMMRFSAIALQDAGLPEQSIYLSMERNMKCAIGFCGHCQFGPHFICKDGPVLTYDRLRDLMRIKEI